MGEMDDLYRLGNRKIPPMEGRVAEDKRWPPVDRYLVQAIKEWVGDAVPPYKDQMTPNDCLVAMAEKRGMEKVVAKLAAISASQRAEAGVR